MQAACIFFSGQKVMCPGAHVFLQIGVQCRYPFQRRHVCPRFLPGFLLEIRVEQAEHGITVESKKPGLRRVCNGKYQIGKSGLI